MFNIIAIFFILIIHYSDASLTLLFLCYIFFIIYRYIEQSCRFSYYKNILKDSNKYNFANSLLEFNRQSITLVAGILFIFFGAQFNLYLIGVLGGGILCISLIMNLGLRKDISVNKENHTNVDDTSQHTYKEIFLTFLLSIPYIINVTIVVSLPAYFNNLDNGQLYYLASLLPYGVGAIFGSFIYIKRVSSITYLLILCFMFLVVSCLYPNVTNAYILQFLMALTNSSIRVYRNISIMNNYSKLSAQNIFNKVELICIVSIVSISILWGVIIDSISVYICWSIISLIYLCTACITFISRKNFKNLI